MTTFSFLYRNERTATWRSVPSNFTFCALSVSSIGTNELQRRCFESAPTRYDAFSFLYRNERTATPEIVAHGRRRHHLSVSSIGTNELQPGIPPGGILIDPPFQFPLSERTNCNAPAVAIFDRATFSFSFLYRNERTATGGEIRAAGGGGVLSVSSIGTNELQLQETWFILRGISSFSFLYRNERTATQAAGASHTIQDELSVSSIGTNELQPSRSEVNSSLRAAFSFLYRNERTATQQIQKRANRLCNFQFPLSERTNCNMSTPQSMPVGFASFSFLYRNERTATLRRGVKPDKRLAFSFLYRNERTATHGEPLCVYTL